jgi:hypothetical protein
MSTNKDKLNIVSLIDYYFDNSNITDDEILVEIVKRVECVRQIENITGIRGMSIHYIGDQNAPDENDLYQTYVDDIELYNN